MTGEIARGGCGAIRELLPEFALGTLTGRDATDVVEHTTRCATCRTLLAELSGVNDALVLLAPEREPAPPFTARVTAAIEARPGRARRARRQAVWIGVGAALAVAALVAGGAVLGRASAPDGTAATPPASATRERSMIGAGGRSAGHAFLHAGEPAWAAVSVDYGTLPPGEYSVATSGSGSGGTVGRVTVDADGRGAWGGTLPDLDVDALRIVDDSGHVLCEARFGTGRSSAASPP